MHERLRASVMRSQVIDMNGYPYMVHPVTDGVPLMDPAVLDEIIEWMVSACGFDCDRIAAPESMGIPLAVPLSLRLRIPYTVIRKRSYGIEGEIKVPYKTGYSDREMYINGLRKGDRVIIVDDILSTGGTLSAVVGALRENGISVIDILVVFNKSSEIEELGERLGVDIKRMLDITVEDGAVRIRDR
ncbi:MAG: hypoxanthine/guanine phosphoribosyltransferase [Methanomassiliicoccaceae archaeon]|nr:hypoxanthine/guanine phosphoribosyltransferase [Methanomassiliicoccaceae archaeon]